MASISSQPLRAKRAKGAAVRVRVGNRTNVACVPCKDRKVRCDGQGPACSSCRRLGLECFIEDPLTKRQQPRDYLEQLEQRVNVLETQLREATSVPSYAADASWDANIDSSDGDDLSSMIGTLSLNTAGSEPTYLGPSSVFAFSRFLKTTLQPAVGGASPATTLRGGESLAPEPCPLPDHQTAMRLSNAYFDNIHTQYPFLHEATFRQWEDKLADPFETGYGSVPVFFLTMVYAIGATLLPSAGYSSEQLYASAMLFIDDVLCYDNLESIQAILICATYSLRSFTGTSQWKLTGQALRLCIDLGYHRAQKQLKTTQHSFQQEMQKRVFWSAYVMECAACVVLGRPLSLRFQDIDVQLPLDIEETQLDPASNSIAPLTSLNPRPTTMMTYAIHAFRLRVLLGRIQTALYSDCSVTTPEKYARMETLSHALEKWWAETPPPRPLPPGGALSVFMTPDFFNVSYDHATLQLYRLQIADRKVLAPDDVFLKCLHAARDMCLCFRRQFLGTRTAFTWSAIHETFLAGLTYIYCLWTSPACRETSRNDEVSSTCTACTVVLVVLGERWAGAAPFRDIFEVLSSRTMTMMADVQQGKTVQPAPLDVRQEACLPDLEQWIADVSGMGSTSGADWLLDGLTEDYILSEDKDAADVALL